MPRYICQEDCYGFRNRRWSAGQEVEISDAEVKNLPRNKKGEIVHFVKPEAFVVPPSKRGQPISPMANPDQLQRKSVIAGPMVSPGTAEAAGQSEPEPSGHVPTPTVPQPDAPMEPAPDYVKSKTGAAKPKK